MAFFDNLFGKNKSTTSRVPVAPQSTGDLNLDLSKGLSLNLNKGMSLDLSKAPTTLQDIRVSAGWDVVARGRDYDLDLCAILLDERDRLINTVYYGNKHTSGIQLDHDNLTGEGDGDDENIFMNFHKIDPRVKKVVICVVIYDAYSRGQKFANVRNAYVRLVDQAKYPEYEICRFNLSEDGGAATAVKFAELTRMNAGWSFKAIGDYMNATISDIGRTYR